MEGELLALSRNTSMKVFEQLVGGEIEDELDSSFCHF
jgi:hypothetical protein